MSKWIITVLILIGTNTYASTWPKVTAKSWLVADGNGVVLDSSNPDQVRSIASISKLMTAMVVLDANQNLEEIIENRSRLDWINLAIVKSDNHAAQVLCNYFPKGNANCILKMNLKAHLLGMISTKFVEPTGLSVMNVSTATELVKLVITASQYPEIVSASQMSEVKIKIQNKWLVFRNTNPIIGKRHKFIVSKTGWITASGGCIVMMLDTDVGQRVIVVLGSKNTHTRIPEAEFIAENYKN
jgi:D-alanyl-D-alanine endopeptidase (penicillin-binding protein 7)